MAGDAIEAVAKMYESTYRQVMIMEAGPKAVQVNMLVEVFHERYTRHKASAIGDKRTDRLLVLVSIRNGRRTNDLVTTAETRVQSKYLSNSK